ncbi:Hsp70 family protein [uncultured Acetatifactor sp.]|uniref:Hsp70 family protein n=1 Tax=uncultured Acetatifactor sp. TaxID=1671927 RepID=UPI002612C363|nr:Hsp70 family protein [uncultured Acetatifactor sp.]
MAIIGIDLGTTNSLAAYWRDGRLELIPGEDGNVLFPSAVGYVEGEGFLVGAVAKERLLTHPDDTVASFKCFMGTAKEYSLGGRMYTPMELSAMVLERLRRNAQRVLQEEIEEAIVTVPAYFNDRQRSDTKKAAQVAGLKVERLINEPSAAALAYRMASGEEDRTLIVFDFGGGTLDLSYVECFENVIEIVAVAGDNHLGGDDIDRAIQSYFCKENGLVEERLPLEELARIRHLAEQSKCALSSAGQADMELTVGGKAGRATLTEDILFELCMPLFGRMKELFLHLLEDADSRVSRIDDLVMVGGSSRLGVVRRFLSELLGKEPVVLDETDRVVALGAGIYAGIRRRGEEIRDMLLTDVCPFTLGIGVRNRSGQDRNILSPMIERNSTLPASVKNRFVTTGDYQREILVKIYQGEEYYVDDNVCLGEVNIEVALKPAGQAWVDVQFTYDINGILHVSVENEMGERRRILLANQALSPEELERYAKEMEKIMLPPIEQPENQETLARFLAYFEESTGEQRERIGAMIGSITRGLCSGRMKTVRNAQETARAWLAMLEESQETKEERLFDGRTSYEWYGEEDECWDDGETGWGGEG